MNQTSFQTEALSAEPTTTLAQFGQPFSPPTAPPAIGAYGVSSIGIAQIARWIGFEI